ncbi:MAG: molybdopterin-dependent oxidoreductase [Acidimicrobiia bacterium]|nr:molybdopterin-dependent oxidoreductase [Acidimicrobiia bacterium]
MSGEPIAVIGACHHDCPDTCAWEVTVQDGRAIKLRGHDEHPFTRGQLCPKVNRFLDRVYHPDRLLYPLRRIGPKGSGEYEPIGWEEAIDEIAGRLRDIADRDPEAILQYSFDGTQGSIQKGVMADRFFDALGASDIRRHLCGVTSNLGAEAVSGSRLGIDPEELRHARFLILWGTNTLLTNRHLWPTIEAAKTAGATLVVIDPIRTQTAAAPIVDEFFQLAPGTDVALVLAMVNVLDRDGLLDREWLEQSTADWRGFIDAAQDMDPQRAASITGIAGDRIEWLARSYAGTKPAAIRSLIGPEHREHGRDIMRAIAMLPALTGAWRERGGGLARSAAIYFDLALASGGERPVRRSFNMGRLGEVLTDGAMIEALVVHNSNPAVITPGQNDIIAGLEREDLFTVVIEQFLTDTARYADYVLPATTQLEHLDLMTAWGHLYLSLNLPAIEPCGETLPNTEIFRRLAAAMGLTDEGLRDSDEDLVRQLLDSDHPWLEGITFDRLRAEGFVRLGVAPGFRPYVDSRPPTADGKLHLGGLDYRPGTETRTGNPVLAQRYPLTMMSRKQHAKFLNANYGGFENHLPQEGEPRLEIHEADALPRGINDGDRVEVRNDRGALTLTATVSDTAQPGLVTIPFGWWNRSTPEARAVNALTNPAVAADDIGSSFFHENLVEVVRLDDR